MYIFAKHRNIFGMIANTQIKLYSSLKNKKFREMHGLFLAEGEKIVSDILSSGSRLFQVRSLIATGDFIRAMSHLMRVQVPEIIEAGESALERISSLSTPNKAILVCGIPEYKPDWNEISGGLSLFLEDIRDPGNLGTIMRTADWFGITNILCTNESVDVYNPKVVQSTMGALCRIKVHYTDLESFRKEKSRLSGYQLIGTVLEGENIYNTELPRKGLIVMGNESKGISDKLMEMLDLRITIPARGENTEKSESLNVSTAAAIVMAEFSRRLGVYSK
jgi:RNA methyltransferase, TrmH family